MSLGRPQKQQLAEKLRMLEAALVESLAQRQQDAAAVELDQTRVGRLSRMDAMQQQALARAALERARSELMRTRSALQRVESTDYGNCVDCSDDIPFERLLADPCAMLCMACQGFRDEDAAEAERRARNRGR